MIISPMLLDTRFEPFDSPNFIFEPKANGVRFVLNKIEDKLTLYTRHGT